ncbi:hypothetical protein LPJ53_005285 [Coemansia erecta]|uniref:Ubiquitin carboxyl-terminal hydrolase n=1 Tax=Coemansia erecta TaxID=147472 RepID=A0A9W7XSR8_9FUNG|nr:hypothetical protein LPJ53_005285 [Coemansia erecta]
MGSDNGNWCLIESDPGVFTELIQNMGVSDVQVEELYSLDSASLRELEPVYGLIFLFKWQAAGSPGGAEAQAGQGAADEQSNTENVYFAQQVVTNACATQAILSVLLNRPEIDLGPMLQGFLDFSSELPADMRGLALSNSDEIRAVHNSFVRPEAFLGEQESREATESDDLFHFVSYVPKDGRLYELDGLKPGPVDHGECADWMARAGEVIQGRMAGFGDEIRFNLMAVIGDRRTALGRRVSSIDASIARLLVQLERLRLDAAGEKREKLQSQIGRLNVERADLEHLVEVENNKFARYKRDNALRKHNFIPMVYQMLRAMARKGVLDKAVEGAKHR